MRLESAIGPVLLAALAGCGGDGTPSASPDASVSAPRDVYPSGPYGTAEGAIIAPLEFTLPDGARRTLADVRRDEGKRLLLLVTGAGWCTACREDQPKLAQLHTEWSAKGLVIMEALFENDSFETADSGFVRRWKTQYQAPFEVVLDAPFVLSDYYDRTLTPMNMFVDLSSMKILRISTGSDPNAVEAIIRARLE